MKPKENSLWRYNGPEVSGCPQGQVHLVIESKINDVVTIGLPYGCGGTWRGDSETFEKHFTFYREKLE